MEVAPATWDEFKGDLQASLRAWRIAPLLPLTSVLLFLSSYVPDPWWWLALPVFLFTIGWFGTERIWYLRIYWGESISTRELWRMTWAFFWRFVRLGVLAAIVWSPVLILAFRNIANDPDPAEEAFSTPTVWITSAILTVVIDFVLTFVTPALAFSTRRVREALRLGLRMLRDHWPQTAWYALVPPLAILLMFRVTEPSSLSFAGRMAISSGSILLNLWFKGATTAFYLPRVRVGSQGAAFTKEGDVGATSAAKAAC